MNLYSRFERRERRLLGLFLVILTLLSIRFSSAFSDFSETDQPAFPGPTVTPSGTRTPSPTPTAVPVQASIKVFLQGAYDSNSKAMRTRLNSEGKLPNSQPYAGAPWNYAGTESVAADFFASHRKVVDWVLVDLTRTQSASDRVARRAGFLLSDGSIVDSSDASSAIQFPGVTAGAYYVVVRHRNHLAVMSSKLVTVSPAPVLYDFTTAQAQAYFNDCNSPPMRNVGPNSFNAVYALYAGEVDYASGEAENLVDVGDYHLILVEQDQTGYLSSDLDLNGVVEAEYPEGDDIFLIDDNSTNFSHETFPP